MRGLLPWYRENRRSLPWRNTPDPYRVWLSEVILQQTRVEQGTAYWLRFVERYPTVVQLAHASEDEVLKLWQGLGYYSRARNLLTAARQVTEQHGGRFPADHGKLLKLKGVGDYTASAIASICFGIPEAVVDGNVYRVLARVFGIGTPIDSTAGRREFRELANRLIDPDDPGDHNQAMMELGATVCTPKKPRCGDCPLSAECIARRTDRIHELPVKAAKTKVRTRHFNYLHVTDGQHIMMCRRNGRDIWQGLNELPLLESAKALGKNALARRLAELLPEGHLIKGRSGPVTHILSHQRIEAVFWQVDMIGEVLPAHWRKVPLEDLERHAVPRLIERYLDDAPGKRSP